MQKYGDPGFEYHVTITRAWALLAAKLVEEPVLGLNATDYAKGLAGYLEQVKHTTNAKVEGSFHLASSEHKALYKPIEDALSRLHNVSIAFDATAASLAEEIADHDIPWWKWWQRVKLYYRVRKVNTGYKKLERQFLYTNGLDGRNWFKHVVFAPGIWTGYAGATFPGLVESLEAKDLKNAQKWSGIITERINAAAESLEK